MKGRIKHFVQVAEEYKYFLFVVCVIAGAFYWYEWRPTYIQKGCWRGVEKIKKGK